MYRFVIETINEECEIYINFMTSAAGHYLNRRPYIIALIKELLAMNKLHGKLVIIEQDMGRNIGTSDVVATKETDSVYYAKPLNSDVFWRFTKSHYPQISSLLTIIAVKDEDGNYEINDTWIGGHHPAFPGDKQATPDSLGFWRTHAFVQDARQIQSKSITKSWPY